MPFQIYSANMIQKGGQKHSKIPSHSLDDFVETRFTLTLRYNHHFKRPIVPEFYFKKPTSYKRKSKRSKAKSKSVKSVRGSSVSLVNKALQIPEILQLILESLVQEILSTSKFILLSELDLSDGYIGYGNQEAKRPVEVIAHYLATKELCRLQRTNRLWYEIIRTAPALQQILSNPLGRMCPKSSKYEIHILT